MHDGRRADDDQHREKNQGRAHAQSCGPLGSGRRSDGFHR
jgi:hypothetical protein